MKNQWHDGSASVILLPGGAIGDDLISTVSEWTSAWMLKPAFWINSESVVARDFGPPNINAKIIGKNGSVEVDLFTQLSRLDIKIVKVVAARFVGSNEKFDSKQDVAVDLIEKYLEQSKPIRTNSMSADEGIKLLKLNLIFAPSEQSGASHLSLLESHWDVNLVVAPEDRSIPNSFDSFTRYNDSQKMNSFILSNIAIAAGIWSGQKKSAFEISTQFSDLSPIQNQVRVMRTFTRGILSEGLAIRVAAEALRRAASASESGLNGARSIPNRHLAAYDPDQIETVIDDMVKSSLNFQNGSLRYKNPDPDLEFQPELTGVFGALKFFFRSSFSLIKVLPLWFFATFWNFLASRLTLKIFGSRGKERIKGSIDFPLTDLDKDSNIKLQEIADRQKKLEKSLQSWPKHILRKSEPRLWEDLRKLILGRLDGSSLPSDLKHDKDASGIRVIGDLNQVIPALDESWKMPDNLFSDDQSAPKFANWQKLSEVNLLDDYLSKAIEEIQIKLDQVTSEIAEFEQVKDAEKGKLAPPPQIDSEASVTEDLPKNLVLSKELSATND